MSRSKCGFLTLGLLLAVVACNERESALPRTAATPTNTASGISPPSASFDLAFSGSKVSATSLPTNVFGSNPTNIPPNPSFNLVLTGQDLELPTSVDAQNIEYFIGVRRLELKKGARIITNGRRLAIRAELVTSDGGQILAFGPSVNARDGDSQRTDGDAGLSARNLELATNQISGQLLVDLRGQNGGNGADGAPGAAGQRGLPGSPGVSAVFDCRQGGGNGSAGGDGGRGGRGGSGGRGGAGGNLILVGVPEKEIEKVAFKLDGGLGGKSGAGGPGGPGGLGGEGGSGSGFCSGGQPGPGGRPGQPGEAGVTGDAGAKGQLQKVAPPPRT